MKTQLIRKAMLLAVAGGFVWWAWKSSAQETAGANLSLQMPSAVSQVLELEQAKIADATIIAYIQNSGASYNLNASQIIYLRGEGLSDAVITAMLTQARTAMSAASPQPSGSVTQVAPPIPDNSAVSAADPPVVTSAPVTYVQTVPVYNSSYCYYPYYSYSVWPRVWWPFSWAWWGGGWHGGWTAWHGGWTAWHGGWGSGWHGGWSGGWHGGWGGSSHGGWNGGWHGGSGGSSSHGGWHH